MAKPAPATPEEVLLSAIHWWAPPVVHKDATAALTALLHERDLLRAELEKAQAELARARGEVDMLGDMAQRALTARGDRPDCPGVGRCHGAQQWCDVCGGVARTCDEPACDVEGHRHG